MKVKTTEELASKRGCQEVSERFGGYQPGIWWSLI